MSMSFDIVSTATAPGIALRARDGQLQHLDARSRQPDGGQIFIARGRLRVRGPQDGGDGSRDEHTAPA